MITNANGTERAISFLAGEAEAVDRQLADARARIVALEDIARDVIRMDDMTALQLEELADRARALVSP